MDVWSGAFNVRNHGIPYVIVAEAEPAEPSGFTDIGEENGDVFNTAPVI
jgi:hypothetical protein